MNIPANGQTHPDPSAGVFVWRGGVASASVGFVALSLGSLRPPNITSKFSQTGGSDVALGAGCASSPSGRTPAPVTRRDLKGRKSGVGTTVERSTVSIG